MKNRTPRLYLFAPAVRTSVGINLYGRFLLMWIQKLNSFWCELVFFTLVNSRNYTKQVLSAHITDQSLVQVGDVTPTSVSSHKKYLLNHEKRKADRGISKSISEQILQKTGSLVPVGSGKLTLKISQWHAKNNTRRL